MDRRELLKKLLGGAAGGVIALGLPKDMDIDTCDEDVLDLLAEKIAEKVAERIGPAEDDLIDASPMMPYPEEPIITIRTVPYPQTVTDNSTGSYGIDWGTGGSVLYDDNSTAWKFSGSGGVVSCLGVAGSAVDVS